MPPTAPAPWTGVRDAIEYGPTAPQNAGLAEASVREDCLVLNVWTRGLGDGAKRPVMVWLHGGGFTAGSGSSAVYDGTNLCLGGDVVVLTINHRLNVFGTNYLGEIIGPEFALSGCAGMLDIVAALEWVRDNIENFGGDPNTVTIFGESGGGRKTSLLLAMPDAQGLFHRAIIQSGAILEVVPKNDGTRAALMLLDALGLDKSNARKLQELPVQQILDAYGKVYGRAQSEDSTVGMAPGTPILDGVAIPQHPFEPEAPAVSKTVPVMVGYNRTEETVYYRSRAIEADLDDDGLRQRVAQRLGDTRVPVERVIETYRKANPDTTPWDLYMLICTDYPRGTYPQTLAVRREAIGSAPTYLYRFDWELNDKLRSAHALEIPFVFDNLVQPYALFDIPETTEATHLAKRMSAAWMAFARTGNPDASDLPHWPAYTGDDRHTMIFNHESRVEKDPSRETRILMEEILGLT